MFFEKKDAAAVTVEINRWIKQTSNLATFHKQFVATLQMSNLTQMQWRTSVEMLVETAPTRLTIPTAHLGTFLEQLRTYWRCLWVIQVVDEVVEVKKKKRNVKNRKWIFFF